MEAKYIFKNDNRIPELGLLVTVGARTWGEEIDQYLVEWARGTSKERDTFIVDCECPRFASGDAKGLIRESIRGRDLFILVDTGNYNCTYPLFGYENHMSPDDHIADVKRLIQATSGKAHSLTVIMPNLYGGRQHRRNYRESLDCAYALQELQAMGVSNVICFDAHDPRVANAVPLMGFDSIMPQYQVLKALLRDFKDLQLDPEHFMVVSPDEGAMNRNMYYSSVLAVSLGMFYKRRDYSRIVNGMNPIQAHEYLGDSVEGKDIFVADDIISSGSSVLDLSYQLKARKAKRVFAYATYAIFTDGLEKFDKAYADGIIDGVLGTNLTYQSPDMLARPWFHTVDCSKYCAYIIAALNHQTSIGEIIDPHEKIVNLLNRYTAQQAAAAAQ